MKEDNKETVCPVCADHTLTREQLRELMIDMLAMAAVARREGKFTDAECFAMRPLIQARANAIRDAKVTVDMAVAFPTGKGFDA